MASVTALLAHQGGWDEVLVVVGPVVVIVGLLSLAKRRVDRLTAGSDVAGDAEERGSGSGVAGDAEERGVTEDHLTPGSAREPEHSSRSVDPQNLGSGDRR